jgi:hypothetical protein
LGICLLLGDLLGDLSLSLGYLHSHKRMGATEVRAVRDLSPEWDWSVHLSICMVVSSNTLLRRKCASFGLLMAHEGCFVTPMGFILLDVAVLGCFVGFAGDLVGGFGWHAIVVLGLSAVNCGLKSIESIGCALKLDGSSVLGVNVECIFFA